MLPLIPLAPLILFAADPTLATVSTVTRKLCGNINASIIINIRKFSKMPTAACHG